VIKADALAKQFGDFRAVEGYTFEVEPGEIYGLLGPNGAGKTTTTRMLSCLLTPSSGRGWVAGLDIQTQAHEIRSRIGILTEVPGLYERLNPQEYLDFFAQVHGLRGPQRAARVEEVLRLVGIWDRRKGVMRSFSKGMQQRVAIARTLLHDPEVLFFDEPTAALDPEAARSVRDHLRHLTEGRKRSVLLCTHNLPEAEELCRRLSIVQKGRQVAEGTPQQLKAGVDRAELLRLKDTPHNLVEAIERVPGAHSVMLSPEGITYRTTTPERTNPEVVKAAVGLGAEVLGLSEAQVSLEEVYLSLIRGAAPLREAVPA
jgi:ABC-2 type transport system ATP-binding protein